MGRMRNGNTEKRPKITRKYRLYPNEKQAQEMREQIRICDRIWNGLVEYDMLKGQRSLAECITAPSHINKFKREARKAYGEMKRAEEELERLQKLDPESLKIPAAVAKFEAATRGKEAADAVVARILPSLDVPFPKMLRCQAITALRNTIADIKALGSSASNQVLETYNDARKSFFRLMKQQKAGSLARGMRPRPPGFRIRGGTATMSCQVGVPKLWHRSEKAQAGLRRAGRPLHARYGIVKIPFVTSPIKFRLSGYGLPDIKPAKPDQKSDPQPVVRITCDLSGRWFACFTVDEEKRQQGGKKPIGIDLGVAVPVAVSVPREDVIAARAAGRPIVGPMSEHRADRGPAVEWVEQGGRRIKQRRAGVSAGLQLWATPSLSREEQLQAGRLDRRIARNRDRRKVTKDAAERDCLFAEYRELLRQRNVYRARVDDRIRDWHEQMTTRLARRSRHVSVEDLNLRNMTASAAGTADVPGKNVAQKRGLNRSLLEVRMGRLKERLKYKVESRDGQFLEVDPRYTSQECSSCHHVDATSRDGRWFKCSACGFEIHADTNAANNTRDRGVAKAKENATKKHGTDSAGDARDPEASAGLAGASAISPHAGEPHPTIQPSARTFVVRVPPRKIKLSGGQQQTLDLFFARERQVLEKHPGGPRSD